MIFFFFWISVCSTRQINKFKKKKKFLNFLVYLFIYDFDKVIDRGLPKLLGRLRKMVYIYQILNYTSIIDYDSVETK